MFAPRHSVFFTFVISLSIALSACGPAGLTAEQVQATANDIAATSVAQTLTALPTNTTAPSETPLPSATPSPMPADTATAEPSATGIATQVPAFVATATPYGQLEPTQFTTAQADKNDKNAPLLMENHTDEEVTVALTSPIYQEYTINNSMIIILAENTYSYRVTVGNKTIVGSFSITNGDKHILSVYADKVHFSTP